MGVVDRTGIFVVYPQYDEISDFHDGLARIGIGNKQILSTHGRSRDYYFKHIIETGDGKYGFIDNTGREVVPPCYDDALDFVERNVNINNGTNKNRYEIVPWQQCVDIDFQQVAVGMMQGPYLVATNICDETIKEVRVTLYAGATSEGYSFYNLKLGETETKPIRMPHFDDCKVSMRF